MVAWNFSRTAARAIDAMSVLEKAKQVRVVTVFNEKDLDTKHSAEEVAKNLSLHGIDVTVDSVDAADRRGSRKPHGFVRRRPAVMGAYGYSRIRDFILGGATKSLLTRPRFQFCFLIDGAEVRMATLLERRIQRLDLSKSALGGLKATISPASNGLSNLGSVGPLERRPINCLAKIAPMPTVRAIANAPPEHHSQRRLEQICAPGSRADRTRNRQENE